MRTFNFETTQHVNIDQTVAGVSDRIFAFFIDILIIGIYIIGAIYVMFFFGIGNGWFSVINLIVIIPVLFYHLLAEYFLEGQSIGKKVLNIKVVKCDGSAAGIGDYAIRWIFRLIEIKLTGGTVALVTILFNGKGQRLGDIAAGTTVVKMKNTSTLSGTVYANIESDYEPKYTKVAALDDADIAIVQDVLSSVKKYERLTYAKIVNKTRKAIEKKTGISTSPDVNSILFLQTVIKDYNAIYG